MAKSNRKLKVDMTGVESYTRCSEGEHVAKVKKVEMGTVQGSGDDCIKAVFEVLKGADKGCQVFETFSLSEKALWKLKSFLQAIGIKADGKLTLDLDKLEGKICVIDVIHEEYNGQKRAKISSYLKESAEDEDEDEDDEEEDDEDEDEEEEAPKPKKSSGKKSAPAKKGKKQPEPEDDDEDDEDEEEEEPPKKSAKKSSKKAAPAKSGKKSKKPEPEEDEDDEDDDWDEDDDD
jgi:ribosomal protein L12E/L44/L45/RPP1/RPP2